MILKTVGGLIQIAENRILCIWYDSIQMRNYQVLKREFNQSISQSSSLSVSQSVCLSISQSVSRSVSGFFS
jgi:hypothetical protein